MSGSPNTSKRNAPAGRDPLRRFSARAEDYSEFRPDYPASLLQLLRDRCGLAPAWLVADLGAGSGRLTKIFLENGNRVIAFEPNDQMRAVAERELAAYPQVTLSDAVAEHTGLADESVDLVVAGSAFHWFDPSAALREAIRIIRPGGWLVLVRMTRRVETPVEQAYETLLSKYSPDHRRLRAYRVRLEEGLRSVGFSDWRYVEEWGTSVEDLLGLSASFSVAPERNETAFKKFESDLRKLFDRFAENGRVVMARDLRVQYCQPKAQSGGLKADAIDPAYWHQFEPDFT